MGQIDEITTCKVFLQLKATTTSFFKLSNTHKINEPPVQFIFKVNGNIQ